MAKSRSGIVFPQGGTTSACGEIDLRIWQITMIQRIPTIYLWPFLALCAAFVFACSTTPGSTPDEPRLSERWRVSFGSGSFDQVSGLAVHSSGGFVLAGSSWGTWSEHSSFGNLDGYARKLDLEGSEIWRHLIATPDNDHASDVAVTDDGTTYVVGATGGALGEDDNLGGTDSFLLKLDANGNRVWLSQWGTAGSDRAEGVSVEISGDVVVVGSTAPRDSDRWAGFIAKFDGIDGNKIWLRVIAPDAVTRLLDVETDPVGNVYAVGQIDGELSGVAPVGGQDALVLKFSEDGEQLWAMRFGSADRDVAREIVGAEGSVLYVLGETNGTLPGQMSNGGPDDELKGPNDIFVAQVSLAGKVEWAEQLGGAESDLANGVAVSSEGRIWVASTSQSFADGFIPMQQQAFVRWLRIDDRSRGSYQLSDQGFGNSLGALGVGPNGLLIAAGTTCVVEPCTFGVEAVGGRVDVFIAGVDTE